MPAVFAADMSKVIHDTPAQAAELDRPHFNFFGTVWLRHSRSLVAFEHPINGHSRGMPSSLLRGCVKYSGRQHGDGEAGSHQHVHVGELRADDEERCRDQHDQQNVGIPGAVPAPDKGAHRTGHCRCAQQRRHACGPVMGSPTVPSTSRRATRKGAASGKTAGRLWHEPVASPDHLPGHADRAATTRVVFAGQRAETASGPLTAAWKTRPPRYFSVARYASRSVRAFVSARPSYFIFPPGTARPGLAM